MGKYIEIVRGSPSNRCSDIREVETNVLVDYYGFKITDTYHSAFMHCEDFVVYGKQNNGIAGYDGKVASDALYWDIDNEDLLVAHGCAKSLVNKLCNMVSVVPGAEEQIGVYFSGAKGFHVYYVSPELHALGFRDNINYIVSKVCSSIAKDIVSFDSRRYARTQIFRSSNTINSKSGLFKIPLSRKQLLELSIDEIKELAKTQQREVLSPGVLNFTDLVFSPPIEELINESLFSNNFEQSNSAGTKLHAHELFQGITNGFTKGARNDGLASVAGMLHRRGFDTFAVEAFLHSINRSSENPLPDSDVGVIARSISRYSVDTQWLDPKRSDIKTMADLGEEWYSIRKRTNKVMLGFDHVEKYIPFFDPQQLMMVAARSGIGKTTMGMHMLKSVAECCNGYGLFFSMEMPGHSLFNRSAIIESNRSGLQHSIEDVTEMLLSSDEIKNKTIDAWKNILVIDKSGLSMTQIKDYYNIASDKYNNNIVCTMVDYVGLIHGTDDVESLSRVAKELKVLAKELSTRVIGIVQVSRKGGDGSEEIKMDYLRGSGSLEDSADYIVGLWRSSNDDHILHGNILKNRFGDINKKFDVINNGLVFSTADFSGKRTW